MLFKIAGALLVAWLHVVVIVYGWGVDNAGLLPHVPLFIGLILLPIAFLKARVTARREVDGAVNQE